MCARETFVGFPLRVRSKAAIGGPDFCFTKISSTKKETPKRCLFFGMIIHIQAKNRARPATRPPRLDTV